MISHVEFSKLDTNRTVFFWDSGANPIELPQRHRVCFVCESVPSIWITLDDWIQMCIPSRDGRDKKLFQIHRDDPRLFLTVQDANATRNLWLEDQKRGI